ncbi:MAG: uroporphyrinogen-III C-methyltransferase [Gammaproteobacteria bacterium]|nr:uroporphyrinogen-III C-methyltransferase [Gammaproteobacteria bacterium]
MAGSKEILKETPVDHSANKEFANPKSKGAIFIDLFFNFVLVLSICFIGYMVYEQDKAVGVLFDQQNALNGQRNEAGERINQLQTLVRNLETSLTQTRQESSNFIQEQAAAISRLENELVSTRLRITTNNPGASQEWLLAEAASLLRLAQQHLVVNQSIRTAQALFIAADDVLKQIDDPAIFSVREILAGELASIRAISEVDVQEIYLNLGAVAEQALTLQMDNDLATQIESGDRVNFSDNNVEQDDSGMLSAFFNKIRQTLDDYFVVRRRDVPIQPLMTPGQEAALAQTIQLQIEQGRTALLKGEQEVYASSLGKASQNIDRFLVGDEAVKEALLTTLGDLSRRRVVSEAPPLNRSRAALEEILSIRTLPAQQAGQQ